MTAKTTIPIVEQLKQDLKDQPDNPLRPSQYGDLATEKERLQSMVDAPPWVPGDRSSARSRLQQINKMLEKQAAKPISDPAKRDRVAKTAKEVLDGVIRPSLLTGAQMRRNPTGAVDHFLRRGEGHPAIKDAILTWKRALRALDPTNDESDYTNLERYRSGGVTATSGFMGDAQIPGVFAMSNLAKDNWPLGDPTIDTAVKQVKRREASEAQKIGLAKARAARQAKRLAAQTPAQQEGDAEPVQ